MAHGKICYQTSFPTSLARKFGGAAGGRVLTRRTEIGSGMGAFAAFADPVGKKFGLCAEPGR